MKLAIPFVQIVIGTLVLVTLAHANPADRAKRLSAKALQLAQNEDFSGALILYEQAIELDASGVQHCNVGAAHFQLDHWIQAHYFLGTCLDHASSLGADFVAQMSKAYAFSQRKLRSGSYGQVRFESKTPGVLVTLPVFSKSASFSLPRVVWLPVGEHSFYALFDGEKQVQTAIADKNKISTTNVIFSPKAVEVEPSLLPPLSPSLHSQSTVPAPSHTKRWIALGTGVAATGLGIIFHVSAVRVVHELEDNAGQADQRSALKDELKQKRTIMAVGYGIGAIAIGLGTYWWLSEEAASAPRITVSSSSATIGMDWSF